MAAPFSLYLHIPFCTVRCGYCDFNTYAGQESVIPPYVRALVAEMELWAPEVAGRPVETVFFGGGTPSLLPLPELEAVLRAARGFFEIDEGAEVTLEANPGTLTPEYLRGARSLGINRLSMGAQSFDDDELRWLGRIHSAADIARNMQDARAAGFDNVSLDLIFGLPGREATSWERSLEEALRLRPEHLSLYALTVEEGTPLGRDVAHGRTPAPDPDLQAAMYEQAVQRLAAGGYEQYEISNWSLPGRECRHNIGYWEDSDWLGLGAGAHSHLGGMRFADERLPVRYIEKVAAAQETPGRGLTRMPQVVWSERPGRALAMASAMILGLRLVRGVDLAAFSERSGVDALEEYADAVESGVSDGLLELSDGRLRLTPRGRLLANEALLRFLPEPEPA